MRVRESRHSVSQEATRRERERERETLSLISYKLLTHTHTHTRRESTKLSNKIARCDSIKVKWQQHAQCENCLRRSQARDSDQEAEKETETGRGIEGDRVQCSTYR